MLSNALRKSAFSRNVTRRLREIRIRRKNYLLSFDLIIIDFLNELLLMADYLFARHRTQSTSHDFQGTFNQRVCECVYRKSGFKQPRRSPFSVSGRRAPLSLFLFDLIGSPGRSRRLSREIVEASVDSRARR